MSTPNEFLEQFGDHSDDTQKSGESDDLRRGNLILRQLDFIENFVEFIEVLRTNEALSRQEIEYIFPKETINRDILPTSITDYLMVDDLNQISLTIVHEDDDCTGFSLGVSAGNREVIISRDPSTDAGSEPDSVFVNRDPLDIERVSTADINAVVVGLVTGKPVERGTDLSGVRIYAPESIENLQQVLETVSFHAVENSQHEFSVDRSINFRQEYYKGSPRIEEITLRYETGNPDRRIRCNIDLKRGLSLTFHAVDSNGDHPFSPHDSDIDRLLEVTSELKVQLELLTADRIDTTEPSALDINDSHSISQTQAHSERYGMTSPEIDAKEGDILSTDDTSPEIDENEDDMLSTDDTSAQPPENDLR
ncbi:MAG: hypothetical protein V4678_02525 [Patescibacteria group bacterium]